MPIVPADSQVDFVRRQVVMSRNISGGPVVRFFMGGLENQVEHHLFPMMARPNLKRAQQIVREHCQQHGIPYTETTLRQSYAHDPALPQPGRLDQARLDLRLPPGPVLSGLASSEPAGWWHLVTGKSRPIGDFRSDFARVPRKVDHGDFFGRGRAREPEYA